MKKVLYIPLDDRACNSRFPGLVADIGGVCEVVTPPVNMLGQLKTPANTDELWKWMFENAVDCAAAVLSVDMLTYGNLVWSRLHHLTCEEAEEKLQMFVKLHEQFPNLQIHAINLVARVAAYNHDTEDPDYWATHGRDIWRHAFLSDKVSRNLASDEEKTELDHLEKDIPAEYLQDFLARRKVDRYVNLRTLDLVEQGVFCDLTIPKDDTAEFGYAAMDQKAIAEKIVAKKLMHKVMIYPGADEAGCVLMSRVAAEMSGRRMRVYVRYSSLEAPFVVPAYEDRPLHESIRAQITSAGCVLVDTPAESDILLAVHLQGAKNVDASVQLNKDVSYYSRGCSHEFMRYIQYYKQTYGGTVVVADVCFVNGADYELVAHLLLSNTIDSVDAYSGWNTAMNTVGISLSHGIAHAFAKLHEDAKAQHTSQCYLMRRISEDALYFLGAYPNIVFTPEKHVALPFDPYLLGERTEEMKNVVLPMMHDSLHEWFPNGFRGKQIVIENWHFPWKRMFDVDYDVKLI